jgi:hypothetical protein
MKFLFLALLPLSAAAAAPSAETLAITRALVNNSAIVAQLDKAGTDHLSELETTELKPGVNQYKLVFTRNCMCIPATATVDIVEDVTPTYRDGAIEYKASISIKQQR